MTTPATPARRSRRATRWKRRCARRPSPSSKREGAEIPARATAETPPSPDKLTIEALSKELQDLKALHEEKLAEHAEVEGQSDKELRLQAEFENFRRRSLKEKQESFKLRPPESRQGSPFGGR